MSSKTVKITNGKILNYKISAPNYKTIYGSKLITADSTISHNMIAEDDPNGVYSLGDRIGNIATFVGYFNAQDPNTTAKTYAVFVLDAAYRKGHIVWGPAVTTGLHQYNTITISGDYVTNVTESSLYNTSYINEMYNPTTSNYQAFYYARTAVSVEVDGITYASQLPNAAELYRIYKLSRVSGEGGLDSFDPTLVNNPLNSLYTWNIGGNSSGVVWTSNERDYLYAWYLDGSGHFGYRDKTGDYGCFGVIPVFEIPVN